MSSEVAVVVNNMPRSFSCIFSGISGFSVQHWNKMARRLVRCSSAGNLLDADDTVASPTPIDDHDMKTSFLPGLLGPLRYMCMVWLTFCLVLLYWTYCRLSSDGSSILERPLYVPKLWKDDNYHIMYLCVLFKSIDEKNLKNFFSWIRTKLG